MKTVMQIIAICAAILEPIIYAALGNFITVPQWLTAYPPITIATMALMTYLTIHSGINYIVGAWKYLDPQK